MDLLDSILGSMEKPPQVKKPEIKDKDKREKFEKMQKERQVAQRKQKEMIDKFRHDISKRIKDFVNLPTTDDPKTTKLELKPMGKLYRSIIHETCEEHDDEIVVHSFGTEDIDRHCTIWRRGYEPCEDEIRAMKLGVEYKPKSEDQDDDDDHNAASTSGKTVDGKDKFWSKYEKIIGECESASGVGAAKVALPARQYGCVPIENKKDLRSIEQMIDDIRKVKKQKTTSEDTPSATTTRSKEEDEEESPEKTQ